MKGKILFSLIGVLIALVTVLTGCEALPSSSSETTISGAMTGKLQINLTDAPSSPEIEQVWLTVAGVKIHKAGNETEPSTTTVTTTAITATTTTTTAGTESNSGWLSLDLVGVARFNLLELQNGLQAKLAVADLTAGKYTQIRMDVTKVEIKLKGDTALKEAKLPSNTLKFVHPFEIVGGQVTEILFDFDALKSINETGNGKYMCKPVIKLTTVKHSTLKFNTGITSDGTSLPGMLATGFTITTGRIAGTMHTLGLTGTVATPALADGDYAFTLQATGGQKTSLKAYFAAKPGWPANYLEQINAEIDGTKPFFYLNAASGVYTLVDSFKKALSISPATLTIDDDYPVGTYVYTGTLKGINGATLPVTVTLVVQ
jgi:hypothetical protein